MRRVLLLAAGATAAAALWWRRNPSACPYNQRFWVEAPHPLITRPRLRAALEPRPGERLLEVGPGTGYYALPVAGWLAPGGTLEILDVQREMLDHTLRRAAEQGRDGIVATQADARSMPYDDASFDAAYLVTVLGEIPDQDAALRELQRVVRPGGRVVVTLPYAESYSEHWRDEAVYGAAGAEARRHFFERWYDEARVRKLLEAVSDARVVSSRVSRLVPNSHRLYMRAFPWLIPLGPLFGVLAWERIGPPGNVIRLTIVKTSG